MKITKKQQQEIDFLKNVYCKKQPTKEDEIEYIKRTVHGKEGEKAVMGARNPLLDAKARLDIQMKMWRKDIKDGLFMPIEITGDWEEDHEYAKTIRKALEEVYDFSTNFAWQIIQDLGKEIVKISKEKNITMKKLRQ